MFKETEGQLRARALRAAAEHLRDEAQVVRDPAHLWEDEDGGVVYQHVIAPSGALMSVVDCGGPRGCVAGWIYYEWRQHGMRRDLMTLQADIEAAVGREVAAAFRDASPGGWTFVVTRALELRGPEACADTLDEVADRIARAALVPA